jgi:hypothetical protein
VLVGASAKLFNAISSKQLEGLYEKGNYVVAWAEDLLFRRI